MIGLRTGVLKLTPYAVEWKRLFDEERLLLQAAVGRYVLDIQHIGSTSIPGMMAKPVLDIGIAVLQYEEAQVCLEPIKRLGYEYRGEHGMPRRHYFVKGDPRTHHLHMVERGSRDWENMILFRDYLIQHPEVARDYMGLKMALVRRFMGDRKAYQDGKRPFIERVLRLARSGALAGNREAR